MFHFLRISISFGGTFLYFPRFVRILQMPRQQVFCAKFLVTHIATQRLFVIRLTNVSRFLFLVRSLVAFPNRLNKKPLSTYCTHKRPLVSMNPFVVHQIALGQKAFVAQRARVHYAAVNLHVLHQRFVQLEAFLAYSAREITFATVNALVDRELRVPDESFVAQLAREWFVVFVAPVVLIELVAAPEALVADRARVGTLGGVALFVFG